MKRQGRRIFVVRQPTHGAFFRRASFTTRVIKDAATYTRGVVFRFSWQCSDSSRGRKTSVLFVGMEISEEITDVLIAYSAYRTLYKRKKRTTWIHPLLAVKTRYYDNIPVFISLAIIAYVRQGT